MNPVRPRILLTVLRCLVVLLILRVLVVIVANYPDYFPPNFESLFLQGRESTFHGLYRLAFYVHIFSGPFVLCNGLLLMSESIRRHWVGLHRGLGGMQVSVLLLVFLPSSIVMSQHAFGGWLAGLSFVLLSLTTILCVMMGLKFARHRRYDLHRKWMLRSYVLICSAIPLRLISGTAGLLEVSHIEVAYVIAAWSSWIIPIVVLEMIECWTNARVCANFSIQ